MVRLARSFVVAAIAVFIGAIAPAAAQSANPSELIILTTTTTQDSGILAVLTDAFAKESGLTGKPIVAGSGDILKQGARGEGDVLLTHSPAAEKTWMADGYGTSRRLIMYNDFVIIGQAAPGVLFFYERAERAQYLTLTAEFHEFPCQENVFALLTVDPLLNLLRQSLSSRHDGPPYNSPTFDVYKNPTWCRKYAIFVNNIRRIHG